MIETTDTNNRTPLALQDNVVRFVALSRESELAMESIITCLQRAGGGIEQFGLVCQHSRLFAMAKMGQEDPLPDGCAIAPHVIAVTDGYKYKHVRIGAFAVEEKTRTILPMPAKRMRISISSLMRQPQAQTMGGRLAKNVWAAWPKFIQTVQADATTPVNWDNLKHLLRSITHREDDALFDRLVGIRTGDFPDGRHPTNLDIILMTAAYMDSMRLVDAVYHATFGRGAKVKSRALSAFHGDAQ